MTPSEIDRLLASIGPRAFGVARRAVLKGLKVLEKAQSAAAPVGKTGKLKRSIGSRLSKAKAYVVTAKAGLNVGKSPGNKDSGNAPHGRWFALGTDERYSGFKSVYRRNKIVRHDRTTNKKTGDKWKITWRGKMAPRPFISRAASSVESRVFQTIVDTLKAGISSELKKQGA